MQPDPEPFASEPWRLGREEFPYLSTLSAAFFHHAVLVPRRELPAPEYVFVPPARTAAGCDALEHTLAMWNAAWEWGHIRPDTFREELPPNLLWIERHPDKVFRLVPSEPRLGNGRLHAYGPLYSLLPLAVLRRFGLPPRGHSWPPMVAFRDHAPKDAVDRLSRALAFHLWPLLSSRSRPGDFSPSDPIRVLSHDLDYWLPFADVVVQRRAQARGRVAFENDGQRAEFEAAQARLPPDLEADYRRPTFGGPVWQGEEEAWEATREVVELADKGGQLRAILDAVRSGRVDDDFSARWSFEREDFERRLHRRRLKWRVSFVELHDTAPVHSPRAEPCVPMMRETPQPGSLLNQGGQETVSWTWSRRSPTSLRPRSRPRRSAARTAPRSSARSSPRPTRSPPSQARSLRCYDGTACTPRT